MNPRFDPLIQEALEEFLNKYRCFREVFSQLTWIKSTDYMAMQGQAAPCWVQYSKYKTYVVLNEKLLLEASLRDYISWCACHEVLHVAKSHAFRFRELPEVIAVKKERDLALRSKDLPKVVFLDAKYKALAMLWNMAADMSINSMFGNRETPRGCLLPLHYNLPNNLSSEGYFELLIEKAKEKEDEDEGGDQRGSELEEMLSDINFPKISRVKVKVKKQKPPDKPGESGEKDDGEKSEGGDVDPGDKEGQGGDESGSTEEGKDGEKEEGSAGDSDSSEGEVSGSHESVPDSPGGTILVDGGKPDDGSSSGNNDSKKEEEEEVEVDEVTPCTCGSGRRYEQSFKPCVHEIAMGDLSEKTESEELEPGEDDFDPGEALRRAMESGFKESVKKLKIKKYGSRAKGEDFDPNNYKNILSAAGTTGRYGGGKTRGGPSDFECRILDTFTEVDPFKWERLLSNFLKTGSKVSVKFTRRKRDRRFGTRPGLQIVQKKHVAFVLDTSGSMSTEKIMSCKSIIDSLSKQMDVTLIQCDWEIRHCGKWTSRDFIKLKGGGGTYFYPAIKTCEYLRVDGMVYYTDGLANDPERIQKMPKPAFDTLWLLVDVKRIGLNEAVKNLPSFGRKLVVD